MGRGERWAESIRQEFELDSSGEEAVRIGAAILDNLDRVEAELARTDVLVPGSRPGTFVPNGLFGETRMLAESFLKVVKALNLPEDDETSYARDLSRSMQNRKNALRSV